MEVLCKCKIKASMKTVTKEGENKGRKFYTCPQGACNFFKWDTSKYDPRNFKPGSCYRCGTWGCEITDCDKKYDYYGNFIPDDYDKYF